MVDEKDNIGITLKLLKFNADSVSHVYYKTYTLCVQIKDEQESPWASSSAP